MRTGCTDSRLPATARDRLAVWHRSLHQRKVEKVVLTPLVLRDPLQTVLARRSRLFATWELRPAAFGLIAHFACDVQPTPSHPDGRRVEGDFEIVELGSDACLLVYDLRTEEEERGPEQLARRSYPLATCPFIRSRDLLSQIVRLAKDRGWIPICTDAMGYDRDTQEFRRDMKHQPATDAFREMAEQGRLVQHMKVSFRDEQGLEHLLATLDDRLVLPAMGQSASRARSVSVQREPEPSRQMVVRLIFPSGTFATSGEAEVLCEAVRHGAGLSVATLHLNPYLNAQIVDWLTGESVQLTITDTSTVSLIPRSKAPRSTLERVVATIFRYFGEADVRAERVTGPAVETA
jgi:hypothetical protein